MIEKKSDIPVICTSKLTKIYGRGNDIVKAVDQIDISTQTGVHGFLGPNGAGKTSTINMLIGAISITSGKAKVKGENAGSIQARRLIGFLPQDPAFYEKMTGEQYLTYIGELSGLRRQDAKNRTLELLENLQLTKARERQIGKYSEGMKQRIGIAAALIHEPELLILDEPTSNLDPIGRANIINDIKNLSKKVSVFVSSHILSEIEQMCENVTMINNGKIVLADTIKNIKKMHSIKSSHNIIILNTNSNEDMIQLLQAKDFISNIWIDENDSKIHIIPNDIESLQKSIPKIILDNNLILREFYQPETSLQDVFIEIMEDEVNKK